MNCLFRFLSVAVCALSLATVASTPLGCARIGYELGEDAQGDVLAPIGVRPYLTASRQPGDGDASLAAGGTSGAGGAGGGTGGTGGLSSGDDAGGAPDDAGGARDDAGGAPDDAGTGGTGGASGTGGSGGSVGGAGGSAGAGTDQPCTLLGSEVVVSQFDTNSTGGIQVSGAGNPTLGWTALQGSPGPGALEFENPVGGAAELTSTGVGGDFSGRVLLVNVYVESGANVDLSAYADSGAARRARGATYRPAPDTWSCVALEFDSPETEAPGFDPTQIQVLGLEISGDSNVRVYIDQVAY